MINALRRYPARIALLPLLTIELVLIYSRGGPWRGDWLWTVDWTAGVLLIVGPLVAGLAAWTAVSQNLLFGDIADMERWRSFAIVLRANLGWLTGVHAVASAVALLDTGFAYPHPRAAVLHGLVQYPVLWGYIGVGTAVGVALPRPGTPIILPVILGGILVGRPDFVPTLATKIGGATGALAQLSPTPSVDVAQAGLGLAILTGAVAVGLRHRRALACVLAGAALAAAAGILVFFQNFHGDRFAVGDAAVRCRPLVRALTVCLPSTLEAKRANIESAVVRVVQFERSYGVTNYPTRFAADGGHEASTTRPFGVSAQAVRDPRGAFDALIPYLIVDTRCLNQRGAAVAVSRLQTLAQFLFWTETGDKTMGRLRTVQQMREIPDADRRRTIHAFLQAVNRCDFTRLPRLAEGR